MDFSADHLQKITGKVFEPPLNPCVSECAESPTHAPYLPEWAP
jgi:hypothetical protein